MSPNQTDRRDFFISFNSADRELAEWIASELERAGYTTFFQHWDFRPGSNFVLEMHKAAELADRTIAVLSPAYLSALFTQPEWAASLVQDPAGSQRKLIPIRVHDCRPEGLLKSIVYADLVGLSEADARDRLLAAVAEARPKPRSVPFPQHAYVQRYPGVPSATPLTTPTISTTPPTSSGYAALVFVCLAISIGLMVLMLSKVQILANFGLTGKLFYLVLIPMALAVAGVLFGVLRSLAKYRGRAFGGKVEFSGPILAAVLVVWGGFHLPPPETTTFTTTVFVHGPAGPQDTILRGQGNVIVDLRGNRRFEPIDEKGAAHFSGIPVDLRGQEVHISVEAEGFERAESGTRKLTSETLYLPVRKSAGRLYGVISDEQGKPIEGARLHVDDLSTQTNAAGLFDLTIPGHRVKPEMTLHVHAPGFQRNTLTVVPGANEIQIRLERIVSRRNP